MYHPSRKLKDSSLSRVAEIGVLRAVKEALWQGIVDEVQEDIRHELIERGFSSDEVAVRRCEDSVLTISHRAKAIKFGAKSLPMQLHRQIYENKMKHLVSKLLQKTFPKGRKDCGLKSMSADAVIAQDHSTLVHILSTHTSNLKSDLADTFASHIPLASFVSALITLVQNQESHLSTYWNRPDSELDLLKHGSFMYGKYEGQEYTTFRNRMCTVEAGLKLLRLGMKLVEDIHGPLDIITEGLVEPLRKLEDLNNALLGYGEVHDVSMPYFSDSESKIALELLKGIQFQNASAFRAIRAHNIRVFDALQQRGVTSDDRCLLMCKKIDGAVHEASLPMEIARATFPAWNAISNIYRSLHLDVEFEKCLKFLQAKNRADSKKRVRENEDEILPSEHDTFKNTPWEGKKKEVYQALRLFVYYSNNCAALCHMFSVDAMKKQFWDRLDFATGNCKKKDVSEKNFRTHVDSSSDESQ